MIVTENLLRDMLNIDGRHEADVRGFSSTCARMIHRNGLGHIALCSSFASEAKMSWKGNYVLSEILEPQRGPRAELIVVSG